MSFRLTPLQEEILRVMSQYGWRYPEAFIRSVLPRTSKRNRIKHAVLSGMPEPAVHKYLARRYPLLYQYDKAQGFFEN